jgi:xylulose-5-phosphate/fructose-6-phosphate phosphoketolase
MDNPNLIVVCVVGDGEAETGPTATCVPNMFRLVSLIYCIQVRGIATSTSILQSLELLSPSCISTVSKSLSALSSALWTRKSSLISSCVSLFCVRFFSLPKNKYIVSRYLGFRGYGYQVRFVEDLENIDHDLAASLTWAVSEIHRIQKAARNGKPIIKPHWPMLILRTPKVHLILSNFCS